MRSLYAVSQFKAGYFNGAINLFLELNINPAKVVALFPESVSGRLSVPQEEWIPLFGGPRKIVPSDSASSHGSHAEGTATTEDTTEPEVASAVPARPPSPHGSIRGMSAFKSGLDSLIASAKKDDDSASIRSKRKEKVEKPKGASPFTIPSVSVADI